MMNLQEEFKNENEGINPEIEYEEDLGTFKNVYVEWLEERIKQLMLGGVSQQREQLYAVCDELEKSTKQLIPPSMKSWVVNKVLADNCG